MIVRFWEARVEAGRLDDATVWARDTLLAAASARAGFASGELFGADELDGQPARVVLLTRWSERPDELDESLAPDGSIARAHGWFFRDV